MGNPMIYMYICLAGLTFGLGLFVWGLRQEHGKPTIIIGLLSAAASVVFMSLPVAMMVEAEANTDVYGTDYAIVEYDGVGTLAVKALFDEQGEVHVLTCFQRTGEETSRCWSKKMDEVEQFWVTDEVCYLNQLCFGNIKSYRTLQMGDRGIGEQDVYRVLY